MSERLKTLIILSMLALLLTLACWSEGNRARSMEAQAQKAAQCRSLDGIPAGGKCFVNAIIETQMVKPEQVFLPYAIMQTGETLYETVISSGRLLGESYE